MTYDKKMRKEQKTYTYSIITLIAAVICFGVSWWIDVKYDMDGSFLQRSGAILVLVGVIVEYLLYKNISTRELHPLIDVPIHERQRNMPTKYNYLRNTAHVFIVFGTLVWGYIDLLWKIS
jgi:hypothetical protein